jgi:hypothetical protein
MLPAIYGQLAAQNALSDPLLQAALAQNAAAAAQQQQSAAVVAAAAAASASSTDTSPTGSRDTMHTKIFVGGLPYSTSDKTLHDYFIQFGDIEEAVVITDRQTQKSRGYGFVTMKERADAEKATRDPNPIIDGRKANVNLAYLGAKPRNNVQLAALSSLQLPIQTQLQAAALFPAATAASRLGLPFMYPGAAATGLTATNPLLTHLSQLQPSLAAALQQQIAAQQQFVVASQSNSLNAALQAQQQGNYFDYASLAAANHQAAAGLIPQVSSSNGMEHQYGYHPYGVISAHHPNLSHLNAAAQAQLAVGSGQMKLDNQH